MRRTSPNLSPQQSLMAKIRVLRRWNVKISIPGFPQYSPYSEFLVIFYPTWADFGVTKLKIPSDIAVLDYARCSFDLEPSSLGMKMFSSISTNWQNSYPDGVPIDNFDDSGLAPRNFTVPAWHWWMPNWYSRNIIDCFKN